MRFSILTPSFNQGQFIEENIQSVLNQNYPDFEHIIIDGGSTDNTIEILKKYSHLKWISEPDNGQTDALKKGFMMATGDIIGWINSDDYYLPNAFNEVAEEFRSGNYSWVIGNFKFKYEKVDKYLYPNLAKKIKNPVTYHNLFSARRHVISQQATFFTYNILQMAGGWDPDYYMIMDYDLWVRLAKISTPKMVDNKTWAVFRIHDEQKTGFKNFQIQLKEFNRIFHREKLDFFKIFIFNFIWYFRHYKTLLKYLIKFILLKTGLINKDSITISPFKKKKYFKSTSVFI